MLKLQQRKPHGQVLVLVALGLVFLVAIVALAVDGGNLYSQRRHMQNAADAGALAGARQLCFEADHSFTAVEAVAQEYAINYNKADEAEVSVADTFTVTVVTTATVDTIFAGVIGFNEVDVQATASAMCQEAIGGDNIWPIAGYLPQWEEEVECDEYVWVFVDTNSQHSLFCDEIPEDFDYKKDLVCDCADNENYVGPGGEPVSGHLGPGDRGWLRLFTPPEPYGEDEKIPSNCGADQLTYWMENAHPGPIRLGDCLPGKSGVTLPKKIEEAVDEIAASDEPIRNIVLYEVGCANCDEQPPVVEQCCTSQGISFYKVAGFGCIEVIGFDDNVEIPSIWPPEAQDCNFQAIVARKRCGEVCDAATGTGGGGVPDPDAVRAVTLIE